TGRALATICVFGELSLVRILVTIHALCKYQRFFEIPVSVALSATYCRVLAFERELCLRVIKALVHRLYRNFLPAARVVTRLAALRKAAAVRIFVAIRALIERNSYVLGFAIGAIRVALGALHLRV